MTQSNGSMGQADKVELRELMAVNGFFKEYRLDSPVNG
jgi:hypothetical protein